MYEIFLKDVVTVPGQDNPCLEIYLGNCEDSFSISVSKSTGMAIAEELCGAENTIPDLYDILSTIIYKLGAKVLRVVVSDLIDHSLFADIVLKVGDETIVMGARSSDAFIIALRSESRMFINDAALKKIIGLGSKCHHIKNPNIYTEKVSMDGITPGDFMK